jgi:hypothetical protein
MTLAKLGVEMRPWKEKMVSRVEEEGGDQLLFERLMDWGRGEGLWRNQVIRLMTELVEEGRLFPVYSRASLLVGVKTLQVGGMERYSAMDLKVLEILRRTPGRSYTVVDLSKRLETVETRMVVCLERLVVAGKVSRVGASFCLSRAETSEREVG